MSKNWQKKTKSKIKKNAYISLKIDFKFKASHSIRNYKNGEDEKIHSHIWKMQIEILAKKKFPNEHGILLDFVEIKEAGDKILQKVKGRCFNSMEDFKIINPSAENICLWFYKEWTHHLKSKNIKIKSISLQESKHYKAVLNL